MGRKKIRKMSLLTTVGVLCLIHGLLQIIREKYLGILFFVLGIVLLLPVATSLKKKLHITDTSKRVFVMSFCVVLIVLIAYELFTSVAATSFELLTVVKIIVGLGIIFFLAFVLISEIKKAILKVFIVNDILHIGKKEIPLNIIDSVWHYDNTYWICTTTMETKNMTDAVHELSEGNTLLNRFSDKKLDITRWLVGWERKYYADVEWWVRRK